MPTQQIHTIVIYPRPHVDNICAIFLLREFGQERFPGIREAQIEYWNTVPSGKSADQWEGEGYLLVDLGGGKFDHHYDDHTSVKKDCSSTLIARYLGIEDKLELKKLLTYVKRDDLEGRGIVSKDVIDRAFGLSAVVMNLNRDYPDHPDYVIDIVGRIFLAHYHEEYRRKVLLPQEWKRLQEEGKAFHFEIMAEPAPLRVVMVESDTKALIGFLRAIKDVQADVVVQRTLSGHTNIVTRQQRSRLNLLPVIAALRRAEAYKKGFDISGFTQEQMEKPGRLEGIEEWYFDTAANTLQNGGAAAKGIPPTSLELAEIRSLLEKTL